MGIELEKIAKRERDMIEKEKEEFIRDVLITAEKEFKDYKKGYKIFSVEKKKRYHFKLEDTQVTDITNSLTKMYKCKLLSVSQTNSPKSYTLTFEK